jgi:hypothetical protein
MLAGVQVLHHRGRCGTGMAGDEMKRSCTSWMELGVYAATVGFESCVMEVM